LLQKGIEFSANLNKNLH